MATQKENKMSRMKGAFGKMKSGKIKFNMTKPTLNTAGKSTKNIKNMFNRFNKNKDDDQKWSSILSGTWEIELPIGEFLNAPPPDTSDSSSDKKDNSINDPNSVSNRQAPMVQISDDFKVISIPLSTDIANPHIHKKYLSSKSITTNSLKLKVDGKDNIKLIHDKQGNDDNEQQQQEEQQNNENDDILVILEGTINIDSCIIRWSDGSSWSKQGVSVENEEEEINATPSANDNNNNIKSTHYDNNDINTIRSQLEMAKEKEKMAKGQSQAMMGQLADLSQQYAKLTTEHEILTKSHGELTTKCTKLEYENKELKDELSKNNRELSKVKGNMIFIQQQEIQKKLTKMEEENTAYLKSIKLQQERILSLQDQLQSTHITTRQYTKSIEDLEARINKIDKEKIQAKEALTEMNAKFISSENQLDDQKHKEMILNDKHNKEINAMQEKHTEEIDKLERGFQETLRQNEKKMQELQTLRNNYEKKNTSLTKDVKKLIIQLEKQAKSFSVSKNIDFNDIGDDNEALKKLRDENAQLSEELIRKSQSLVDALRALAEFHETPDIVTKSITSNLSHAQQYMFHNDNNNDDEQKDEHKQKTDTIKSKPPSSYADVSNQLQISMENDIMKANKMSLEKSASMSASPPSSNNIDNNNDNNNNNVGGRIVIGAKYGINDEPPSIYTNKFKFNRFKNKFGNKMKEQITKIQQNMVHSQIQKHKSTESPTLNELNAKTVIKESEKVLNITKTKQQLNHQCEELQGLANELSSTIEQKEVILESLRFANTYLGKRVIALEKLMKMEPGKQIPNQDELIRDAINISSPAFNKNDKEEENIENKQENEEKEDVDDEKEKNVEDKVLDVMQRENEDDIDHIDDDGKKKKEENVENKVLDDVQKEDKEEINGIDNVKEEVQEKDDEEALKEEEQIKEVDVDVNNEEIMNMEIKQEEDQQNNNNNNNNNNVNDKGNDELETNLEDKQNDEVIRNENENEEKSEDINKEKEEEELVANKEDKEENNDINDNNNDDKIDKNDKDIEDKPNEEINEEQND